MVVGVQVSSSGTWGINLSGTYSVGVDVSNATITTSAIRIKGGDNIAFDASSTYRLRHSSTGIAGLTYSANGSDKMIFSDTGGIILVESIAWTAAYGSYTTATAGSNGAPPAQVRSYILANVNGTDVKIPCYNV
jgi:hypothetical protein